MDKFFSGSAAARMYAFRLRRGYTQGSIPRLITLQIHPGLQQELKTLTALVVVQLVVLFALFMRMGALENEGTAARSAPQSVPPTASFDSTLTDRAITVTGFPDENRIREIIREELAVQLDGLSVAAADAEKSAADGAYTGAEYEYRRESVAQSVDYYVSAGRITEFEMADLQQQIAGLKPEDRQAMFRQLVRAMNTGALDGRL
jgi:hypothetical protein